MSGHSKLANIKHKTEKNTDPHSPKESFPGWWVFFCLKWEKGAKKS